MQPITDKPRVTHADAASEPKLSVILPNYNHAHLLPRALDALLVKQTRPAHEILIIDDGSTDDSLSIIEDYAARFDTVKILIHDENQGVAEAVNFGLSEAVGTHIYGAGADDWVRPNFFASVFDQLKRHPNAGTVVGQIVCRYKDHRRPELQLFPDIDETGYIDPINYRKQISKLPSGFSLGASTIYRTDYLKAIGGFRRELGSWADTFAGRVLGLQSGVIYIHEPCVDWTVCMDSYSHNEDSASYEKLDEIGRVAHDLMIHEFPTLFTPAEAEHWHEKWKLEMAGGFERLADIALPRKLRDVRRAYAELGKNGTLLDRTFSKCLREILKILDRTRTKRTTK
jgi:glycosyltransferase involved in cell wall biosynthesis